MSCQTNNYPCEADAGRSRIHCGFRRGYCCCAVGFLALLVLFAVGLILGAVYYETILPVLASVIAFTAAIAAVAVALVIYCLCRRND